MTVKHSANVYDQIISEEACKHLHLKNAKIAA